MVQTIIGVCHVKLNQSLCLPSLILTLWYPDLRSNLEKYFTHCSWSIKCSFHDLLYRFFLLIWRLCIDYRSLNKITVKNRYPPNWRSSRSAQGHFLARLILSQATTRNLLLDPPGKRCALSKLMYGRQP